jgi:hypothetical protein
MGTIFRSITLTLLALVSILEDAANGYWVLINEETDQLPKC